MFANLEISERKLIESEKLRSSYEEYFDTVSKVFDIAKARTRNMSFEEGIKESIKLTYQYLETNGTPDKFFPIIEKKAKRFATRRKKTIESRKNRPQESCNNSEDSETEADQPHYGKVKPCGGKNICRKMPQVRLTTTSMKQKTEAEASDEDSIKKEDPQG